MTTFSLDQAPWIASLTPYAQAEVAAMFRPAALPAGAILFREGERGDTLCLLLDGQVEIVKSIDTAEERLIRVQGPGALLGEMALFDPDGLHTASVRALTDLQLAVMTQADFNTLIAQRPALALDLVRTLSMRLRDADNATIHDLCERNVQLAEAYRQLQEAHEQIVEKEKLERELQLAREMQEAILPRKLPRLGGYDFAATMVPARTVGGDFFDLVPLGGDSRRAVANSRRVPGAGAAVRRLHTGRRRKEARRLITTLVRAPQQ
jgi:CRP-like cAMP-binding protein